MNMVRYFFLLFCLLISSGSFGQKLDHVLGEVIVEVKSDNAVRSLLSDLTSSSRYHSRIEATNLMKEPMNLWVLKIDPNQDNELDFLSTVKMNRNTLQAQKNHLSELRQTTPDDPLFSEQWQYINLGMNGGEFDADLDIDLAWDHATGGMTIDGDEIVVCVIDDGIVPSNPDLDGNLWINTAEIPDNGIDDDGNGYIDDVRGWNAGSDNDNVYQGGGHGTQVAGIVGAKGNNTIGVSGVNWDVKMMIVIGGSPESLALASYAYPYTMRKLYNETNGEEGAFVVSTNASWGVNMGNPEDAPIWCDFYNILGEEGILNFGATINGNTNVDVEGDLPTGCTSDFLVSVTNMNREDEKVTGAGYGARSIDLGAYGAQTYTLSGSNYGSFGGTSAATPHCAGTAALLYSANCTEFMSVVKSDPALAALAVKDYILHGVVPNQSLEGITTTGGRLNVNNAILNLLSTCEDCTEAFGVQMSDIQVDKSTLTWLDNGKVGEVTIRYRELDSSDWVELENITSGYQFTNLLACTAYEYQIKTRCSASDTAAYTYPRLFQTDGCCVAPEGISAELVDNEVIVNWGNVLASTNFVLEYKIADDSVWTAVELGTENSFSFSQTFECQQFEIRIKSKCEATSLESEFSEIIRLSTDCGTCSGEYCLFGDKIIEDEWIRKVAIPSKFENLSSFSSNGYENFIGKFNINLDLGKTYEIQLAPGYTDAVYDEYFFAYIDFNQDNEFTEDEAIYLAQEATTSEISGLFTIPLEAELGITRMRIIMRYLEPNDGPCDNPDFEYGEIEDYCVEIVSDVNTIDINTTSFSIYPTLTSEAVTIDLGNEALSNGIINLFSTQSGQLIKSLDVRRQKSLYEINLSELPTGVYMVVINIEGVSVVQKVVKM